jgi:methionyl-tRNA synthetase
MPWGVPVPGDDTQVMYVWFDALVNYISTLGWPETEDGEFLAFWGAEGSPQAVQIAGKDNLRQQSAMWQAMLMSAGLPTSRRILVNGFITSGGQKMSKSLGNVVDPVALVAEYGADAVRYWAAREASPFEDSDFTPEKFRESYNGHLANGVGNLASRILKMAEANDAWPDNPSFDAADILGNITDQADLARAMDAIWREAESLDREIQENEPFRLVKEDPDEGRRMIRGLVSRLAHIAGALRPFLPSAAGTIGDAILARTALATPVFPRK